MTRLAWITLLGLAACKSATPTPAGQTPAARAGMPAPVSVQTAAVQVQPLPPVLELSGTLEADERSEVAAATPGVVTQVAIDVGSVVKEGDVLVHLDRRDAAFRRAQASAATAQTAARLGIEPNETFAPQRMPEVQAAKEAMQLAETEAKRAKLLFEGGSAPQALADQARARAETARAQYEAALNGAKTAWAALKMARAAEDLSEKASADTDVRAPFAGVVAERRITAGEYAMPGRVVAVLVKTDRLRLKVDVPESEASKVTVGGEVQLTVAAWPGRVFTGKVARVGAALKPMSRALPIEAEIDNADGALKPGFFAHVQLVLPGDAEPATLVPAAAIGTSGSAARVFAIEGGSAVEHVVAVGRAWQGLVEVRGTLPAQAQVAIDHLDELSDGARVARNGK